MNEFETNDMTRISAPQPASNGQIFLTGLLLAGLVLTLIGVGYWLNSLTHRKPVTLEEKICDWRTYTIKHSNGVYQVWFPDGTLCATRIPITSLGQATDLAKALAEAAKTLKK